MNFNIYKKIIIFLIIIFIIINISFIKFNNSYATDIGEIVIDCDKDIIKKEEEFEISINLENNSTAVFTMYLYFDDTKVEFLSGPDNINLIGNHIVYVWHDITGGNSAKQGTLAKFKFKAKDDGIANFVVDGEFYNKSQEQLSIQFKDLQIQIGNMQSMSQEIKTSNDEQGNNTQVQNANLKVLRLNREGLVPTFEENIYEYYLTVLNNVNDIEILTISDNPNATIEIDGNNNLKEGLNIITIKVISEDKTQTNVYTIQVTKTANLESSNTNLEILAIENVLLYPQFGANVTNYKAEISNDISDLNILAVPENEKAIVEVIGKNNLKEGNNLVSVYVTALNGISKREYKVNVYKRNQEEETKYQEAVKDNQNKLEEIYDAEKTNDELSIQEDENHKRNIIIGVLVIVSFFVIFLIYNKKRNS